MTIRTARDGDQDVLGQLAQSAGLFPAEYLPEMLAPALAGASDAWLVAEREGTAAGFALAREEQMTDRVWNILAIGVAPEAQGTGLGRTLLSAMEKHLTQARLIIIETTQRPEQDSARALYAAARYRQVAHIPDFYSDGEDKIVFLKRPGVASEPG